MYEHFSNRFISAGCVIGFQSKTKKRVKNDMLDLAISVLACLGLFALPFILIGYVRPNVRHTLSAPMGKVGYA
jgi:hypothetical protein